MEMDMNLESNRLRSFRGWPQDVAAAGAETLAKCGFFATGTGDGLSVECNWCHLVIEITEPNNDFISMEHYVKKPNCPFILDEQNCGNIPLSTNNDAVLTIEQGTSTNPEPSTAETSTSQSEAATTTNTALDMKNEGVRLATFKNWPNPNISPQSLAKAGFYYFNQSDQVRCAWCKGIIAKWEKDDNAFDEHRRFFPQCQLVQLGPLIEIANDGIQNLGIQQICPPQKPKFSSLDARMRTYIQWPIPEVQKPEILAQAGFYYQNIDDQVRCFHCNGGLRSWQKEDDPWFEHAKWFPYCQFVKLVKGPLYVTQVQETRRNGHEAITVTEAISVRQLEQVMSLDEAMMTEPVRRALEMGLNEGRIRNATRHQLEYCGKPYDTTEELVEAVLEGQADEEDDDDSNEQTIREVSRILNTIFSPRNANDSDGFDQVSSPNFDDYNFVTIPMTAQAPPPVVNTISRSSTVVPENVSIPNAPMNSSDGSGTSSTGRSSSTPAKMEQSHTTAPSSVPVANTSNYVGSSVALESMPSTSTAGCEMNRQLSLEEENRKLKDARLCKVCMDDEVAVVFLPCGHLVTCVQCAPGVNQCPLCRQTINGFVRTFLS